MNPARIVFPALRWGERGLDSVWPEVENAIELGVGGFIVFGGDVGRMRALVARALEHAARPLIFAADLERGAGQQFAGATQLPPPAALANLGTSAVEECARMTAREAMGAGVHWLFAPVADLDVEPRNPIVGTRSFGSDPDAIATMVSAWIKAAQSDGALACAKHFPGHGRTTVDSHAELPVVGAEASNLRDDLIPFAAAVEAGVGSVMLAHVSYPALDSSGAPASVSRPIVDILRDELKFDGLVVTDALIMEALASAGLSEAAAAVAAVNAGCDALLYPRQPAETVRALGRALDAGELPRTRLSEAIDRVGRAARELRPKDSHSKYKPLAGAGRRALELARSSLRWLRSPERRLSPGQALHLHIIDDDAVGPAVPILAGAPGLRNGAPDRDEFARSFERLGAKPRDSRQAEDALDVLGLFCDVKAWKARAGLAPETIAAVHEFGARHPEATVVLFAHPRIAAELPDHISVLCAWGADRLMIEAAAELLTRGPAT